MTELKEVPPVAAHEIVEYVPPNVQSLTLPESVNYDVDRLDLPYGYGLVGGSARAIASEVMCGRRLPVRDVDVMAFTDFDPDRSYIDEISERLMPDDHANRHGVQVSNLTDYFGTRDFTVNELAVVSGKLLVSDQAVNDLRDNVIRPTRFEHDPERERYLNPRLAVKAVLMQTVLESTTGDTASIEGVDLSDYYCDVKKGDDDGWTRPFYVALGFQKALEYGEDVAGEFLDKMISYGMVRASSLERGDESNDRLTDFAEELEHASDFEFRGTAAGHLAALRQLSSGDYTLGDLLYAIDDEALEGYVHYHELAQTYGGRGRQYTDESKY